METLAVYLLLGVFAGILAGLLGVGGGILIVPALVILFEIQGISNDIIVHLAVGTSLSTIIFTSISSVSAHHKKGAVLWETVKFLTPGIIVGAWLGSAIADLLPTKAMKIFFGLFELYVAIQMSMNIKPKPHRQLPGKAGSAVSGTFIGTISSIVGIGGGTLTVPYLTWCNVNMRNAIATSSACGLPIAIAGATGFLITGWNNAQLPDYSTGYIYWPALIGIVVTSFLFAPLGAKLAHTLPVPRLKQVFALLLYVLAFKMLFF